MSLGFTADELSDVFLDRLGLRLDEFVGDLEAIKAGENPAKAKALSELEKKFPSVTAEQFGVVYCLFMALMDTIASNNEELSKAIPHVNL